MRRAIPQIIVITCLSLTVLSGVFGSRVPHVSSAPAPTSLQSEFPANTVATQDLVIVQRRPDEDGSDPDRPPGVKGDFDQEAYLRLRDEYVALRRGVEIDRPFDLRARGRAIQQLERQEKRSRLESLVSGSLLPQEFVQPAWNELGPKPIPNGQGQISSMPVTGRATCIAIDPTNSSRVYLGTAQGGVWRSLDGGVTWANIFDAAQSLAIGAIAVASSDPSKVYVGTGEANQSGDSFFGVGMYRIDNAFTTADLVGPINPIVASPIAGLHAFTGRGITRIAVHPASADIVFATTAGAVGGSGANTLSNLFPPLALRGLYRSMNATAAAGSVGFTKLTVTPAGSELAPPDTTGNRAMYDVALDPANPTTLLCTVQGQTNASNDGGVYRTTNALDPSPSFAQTFELRLLADGSFIRSQLAMNGSTVYLATGEASTVSACITAGSQGVVRKSVDGGVTWSAPLSSGQGFCGAQCSYNLAIAVNPANANVVYIGGQGRGTCSDVAKLSQDGGNTFVRDDNNLHADTHAIVFDGQTVYTASDGGVWKRQDGTAGSVWTNLNTAPLGTLQFVSLAVHPLDQNLTIGGTQDNGTELQTTVSGSWFNVRGGDGGYTLIDQNAPDTTTVTMYHTFFFRSGEQIRYERATTPGGSWLNIGCTGGTPANGINCSDRTLFYAPMALGPGAPNRVYLGTDRLYRSTDAGISHTIVSPQPIVPTGCGNGAQACRISSIAISPQDDNYRVLGFENGQVWATATGSPTLVNLTASSPFPVNPNGSTINKFVGRAIVDPNNKDIAYIGLSYYAPAGQGVWKITNLGAAAGASPVAPIWVAAGNGIPSIPINSFAVDPLNSNNLFAGTDIGVYNSTDGGASWLPYGTGFPRVTVFDMKIQPTSRLLRVATHGRGMWDIPIGNGAQAPPAVQFDQPSYTISEGAAFATINVTRTGDTSVPATVKYATSDATDVNFLCNPSTGGQPTGAASRKCDYHIAVGRLRFAAGETSKPIILSIVNDVYVEPSEWLTITLSSPTGATLGTPNTATVAITDNDTPGQPNPVDGTAFYVRMLYVDLLSREPDPAGNAGWIHRIDFCGQPGEPPPPCDRVTVGGDGFLRSAEFFDREFFVIRLYRTGLGRILRYDDVGDLAYVSGFLSDADLELNKQDLVNEIMSRSEFGGVYNGLGDSQFVDTLIQTAAVTLPAGVRDGWVNALNGSTMTRPQVFRELSERAEVSARYLHEAQVVSCYYGFFTRNPDGAYLNFLDRLDRGEINLGDLANAFINAPEYRQRFGP